MSHLLTIRAELIMLESGVFAVVRLLWSLSYLQFWKTSIWNTIWTALVCVRLISNSTHLFLHVGVGSLISREIFVFCVILISTALTESWIEAREVASLQMRASELAQNAARKLLSVLCDVVIRLGPDLKLREAAPKLCALLLTTSSQFCSAGSDFVAHIVKDDKQRFLDFISASELEVSMLDGEKGPASSRQARPAAALHLKLQDTMGSAFPVEIFHVYFPTPDEQPGHLIGLRETGDRHVETPDAVHSELPALLEHPQPQLSSEKKSHSWSSQSSQTLEIPDLTLDVDWRPDAEILTRCSFNLWGKGKRAPSLLSCVEKETRKPLYAWMQEGLNSKLYQEQHPDMGPFSMRPLGPTLFPDSWLRVKRACLEIPGEPDLLAEDS
eukprot:CAMPEP_0170570646 /NCGR_PEP_ID=MMETSP0224-20130122/1227_1 /TAXON_ID=285029 /ORGANISM="Togula jolla, Strain CCCM 725" /LENGTH=383 /DNA_ID=CAMNT_0010892949 /DNA_START=104 /DNA_END=1252 /DNA_ORIENTATION=+